MHRPPKLVQRLGLSALLLVLALPLGACTAGYRGTVVASSGYVEPDLVYVSPGVYVVADYDYPVFYSANFYWRQMGDGRWYRSRYHDRGFGYGRPPQAVVRIDQPTRYRNYRGGGYITSREGDRRYYRDGRGRVRIRDHRR